MSMWQWAWGGPFRGVKASDCSCCGERKGWRCVTRQAQGVGGEVFQDSGVLEASCLGEEETGGEEVVV